MTSDLDVVALGGNAILPSGKTGTIHEQLSITRLAMEQLIVLLERGRRIVITHGNGPIVGNIVIRNEAAKDTIPPMPLDICGADSQGGIGYMIQQALRNALIAHGVERDVVSVVTQVVVDGGDPAFGKPVKPIGPFYTREEAEVLTADRGWVIVKDSNRGFRRVVPSPKPVRIVEIDVIGKLVSSGAIVIACGGGGVPVIEIDRRLEGREAVVDKDLTAALLGGALQAERLIILTDVDAVYRDFGTPQQAPIRTARVSQIKAWLEEGSFPRGSMGSKLEAVVDFLAQGGKSAVICRADNLVDALEASSGTTVVP